MGEHERREEESSELYNQVEAPSDAEVPAGVPAPSKGTPSWLGCLGGFVLLVALTIGGIYVAVTYNDHARRAEACSGNRAGTAAYLAQGRLDQAERSLQAARHTCGDSEAGELARLEREIVTQKTAADAERAQRGIKITKDGYLAALTRGKLDMATKYGAAHGQKGIEALMEKDPDILILPPNVAVDVLEQDAVYRRVRVRGTMLEYWTYFGALRDP